MSGAGIHEQEITIHKPTVHETTKPTTKELSFWQAPVKDSQTRVLSACRAHAPFFFGIDDWMFPASLSKHVSDRFLGAVSSDRWPPVTMTGLGGLDRGGHSDRSRSFLCSGVTGLAPLK